ncbi:MAG: hypothetical protein NTX61_06520 [Bacteroidetes bacterium]|nr:hypothetical protein [Bacteroidota bacterium]
MTKRIAFLNYNQLPFSNTAHSMCFTNLFYRFVDQFYLTGHKEDDIEIHLLGLSIKPEELETPNANFDYYKNNYAGKVTSLFTQKKYLNSRSGPNVFYGFLEFIRTSWLLRKYLKSNRIDTVVCYSDAAFYIIFFSLTLNVDFIFDCKGDRISELIYDGRSTVFTKVNDLYQNFLLRRIRKILISSTTLEDLYIDRCKKARFIENTNYYDDKFIRHQGSLKPGRKTRFVYSGSTVRYQMFDETLLLFKYYHDKYPDSELLLLIRDDHAKVREKIEFAGLDQQSVILAFAPSLKELNDYLNTCDIAIMLRDSVKINFYAFPTKFAEYLAAGLPVIGTIGVYDTWNVIRQNDLGVIINLEHPLNEEIPKIHDFISRVTPEFKCRCADWALQHLSWNHNIQRIYDEIVE